jgi:hypothetical protein
MFEARLMRVGDLLVKILGEFEGKPPSQQPLALTRMQQLLQQAKTAIAVRRKLWMVSIMTNYNDISLAGLRITRLPYEDVVEQARHPIF